MASPSKLNDELINQANEYLQLNIENKRYPTIRALTDELGITRKTFYKYAVLSPKMAKVKSEILNMQQNFSNYFA